MRKHTGVSGIVVLIAPLLGFFAVSSDGLLYPIPLRQHTALRVSTALPTDPVGGRQASEKSESSSPNKKIHPVVTPTHRSTAVFALLESNRKTGLFAVRKLENDPNYISLNARDRAFARNLVSTTERRLGQIDTIITSFVHDKLGFKQRPVDKLCIATLRVGAAQLLFLDDIPSYAALKETVEVLRMHPKIKVNQRLINFVNAVLRKIDREGKEALKSTSIYANINPWLIKKLKDQYGDEKTTVIVERSMIQSPIFLSVRHDPKDTKEERKKNIEKVRNQFAAINEDTKILSQGSIRVPTQFSGSVSSWPGYKEGNWWVQDCSATLPAIALANAFRIGKEMEKGIRVVDLCSAPGGKTAQLCGMDFEGVTAVELSAKRTKTLKDNLKRLRMEDRCDVVVADGREWRPDENQHVDGVLVDAPCSATGVGSRRPDVLRKKVNLDELSAMQREIAAHAVDDLLRPGGVMVYATCSLLKQESEDQMKWLLAREDGATVETIPFVPGEIPGFDDAIDENGWLRVLPGVLKGSLTSCDGFFVARLKKVK